MDPSDADRVPPVGSPFYEAEFIDTADGPGDELRVKIPGFDGGTHYFDVEWEPRPGGDGDPVYPAKKDWAVVAETDGGTWIVLLWKPT